MNSSIAKLMFMAGAKYRNPSLWGEYWKLKKSEWYTREQLAELQATRVRDFLTFVERWSPYYKKLFRENNFSASDMSSIECIKKYLR